MFCCGLALHKHREIQQGQEQSPTAGSDKHPAEVPAGEWLWCSSTGKDLGNHGEQAAEREPAVCLGSDGS